MPVSGGVCNATYEAHEDDFLHLQGVPPFVKHFLPVHVTYKEGVTKELATLLVSICQSTTNVGQFHGILLNTWQTTWYRRVTHFFSKHQKCGLTGFFHAQVEPPPKCVDPFWIPPADSTLRYVYSFLLEMNAPFSAALLHSSGGKHLRCDHTFQIVRNVKNATQSVFRAQFSIMNEYGEIVAAAFVKDESFDSLNLCFQELKQRYLDNRWDLPTTMWTDKCCEQKRCIQKHFPNIQVKMDLFHYLRRWSHVLKPHLYPIINSWFQQFKKMFWTGEGSSRRIPDPQTLIQRFMKLEMAFSSESFISSNSYANLKRIQLPHIVGGCLSDPEGIALAIPRTDGIAYSRTIRGTSQQEGYHLHLQRSCPGTHAGAKLVGLTALHNTALWNLQQARAYKGQNYPHVVQLDVLQTLMTLASAFKGQPWVLESVQILHPCDAKFFHFYVDDHIAEAAVVLPATTKEVESLCSSLGLGDITVLDQNAHFTFQTLQGVPSGPVFSTFYDVMRHILFMAGQSDDEDDLESGGMMQHLVSYQHVYSQFGPAEDMLKGRWHTCNDETTITFFCRVLASYLSLLIGFQTSELTVIQPSVLLNSRVKGVAILSLHTDGICVQYQECFEGQVNIPAIITPQTESTPNTAVRRDTRTTQVQLQQDGHVITQTSQCRRQEAVQWNIREINALLGNLHRAATGHDSRKFDFKKFSSAIWPNLVMEDKKRNDESLTKMRPDELIRPKTQPQLNKKYHSLCDNKDERVQKAVQELNERQPTDPVVASVITVPTEGGLQTKKVLRFKRLNTEVTTPVRLPPATRMTKTVPRPVPVEMHNLPEEIHDEDVVQLLDFEE